MTEGTSSAETPGVAEAAIRAVRELRARESDRVTDAEDRADRAQETASALEKKLRRAALITRKAVARLRSAEEAQRAADSKTEREAHRVATLMMELSDVKANLAEAEAALRRVTAEAQAIPGPAPQPAVPARDERAISQAEDRLVRLGKDVRRNSRSNGSPAEARQP